MRPKISEITYFETYYFANILNNILRDPYPYLRRLDEYFGDLNYKKFLEPFPKISALHDFIIFIIFCVSYEDLSDYENDEFLKSDRKIWVEIAFDHFGFEYESFDTWLVENNKSRNDAVEDDILEYFTELRMSGPYEELLDRMSNEIFFILFLNRQTLQKFNELISHQINDLYVDMLDSEDKSYFRKDGVLKRYNIPKWVQRAVLHRDRGMCTACNKDLSGIINIGETGNFDHIIPLAKGGINDVTNIQLLCETCNKSKQSKMILTSSKYEQWY